MNIKKAISLGLLGMFVFGVGATTFTLAEATPQRKPSVIKKTYHTTKKDKVEISYFKKRTSLKEETIADFLSKGYSRNNIKEVYVLSLMSTEKFENVVAIYQDEDRKVDLAIKDLKLNQDDFKKEFNKTFPEGDDTDFDRIKRSKPVWSIASPPNK